MISIGKTNSLEAKATYLLQDVLRKTFPSDDFIVVEYVAPDVIFVV